MFGNRVLSVNGRGPEMLLQVLRFAFEQAGVEKAVGCSEHPRAGLLLLYRLPPSEDPLEGLLEFEHPLDAGACLVWAERYLGSPEARQLPYDGWDAPIQGFAENTTGWRVYVDGWGKVLGIPGTICAVRPAYLWPNVE
jgi:hypothetical protein